MRQDSCAIYNQPLGPALHLRWFPSRYMCLLLLLLSDFYKFFYPYYAALFGVQSLSLYFYCYFGFKSFKFQPLVRNVKFVVIAEIKWKLLWTKLLKRKIDDFLFTLILWLFHFIQLVLFPLYFRYVFNTFIVCTGMHVFFFISKSFCSIETK